LNHSIAPEGLRRVALSLCVLAAFAFPTTSFADEGGVELTNGGRMNGNVMVVVPGEHVALRLADGTTVYVGWSDVLRVYDGPRVYEASGQVTVAPRPVPAPPRVVQPIEDAPPMYQREPQRQDDFRLLLAYENLPSRAGTAFIFVGSAIFSMNGLGMMISGAMVGCYDYDDYGSGCGFRRGMVLGGAVSLASGVLMFWRGLNRRRERERVIHNLLVGGPITRTDNARELTVDARIDGHTFVPRLTMSF
jgi:hypothetical protein